MRLPIKLNRAALPASLRWFPFAVEDPSALLTAVPGVARSDFSRRVSIFKFGTTFKSTSPERHRASTARVCDLLRGTKPVVLDIGASDGSTSLDLIRALGDDLGAYYVTDRDLSVSCGVGSDGALFFRDAQSKCILRAGKWLVVYADAEGAPRPLKSLTGWLLADVSDIASWGKVSLVQPELSELCASDPRIRLARHDMFDAWTGPRPDLVKIANVLNRDYFSDERIRAVLRDVFATLNDEGHLLLVDNRPGEAERFSILRKRAGRFELESRSGGGCDVESLALACASAPQA